MSEPTDEIVHAALAELIDPLFQKPMAQLGLIEQVERRGSAVSMTVRLSSPSAHVRETIERDVRRLLEPHGVTDVELTWDVQIPMRAVGGDDPVPQVRNVVLVMSGKGGVGKSTCAVNLAVGLARLGARVGVLDADIYGPSLPTMMGVCEPPVSEDGEHIKPLERFGVKLMSIGFMLEDPTSAIVWRGPMLHGALQQLLKDVMWGELDYLVLDLPPGTGDVALTLAQRLRVTGVVVVTTPQEVALQDVYKSVSMCRKLNLPIIGVVENMSFFIDSAGVRQELFGKGGGQKVADFAKAPLLGQVPLDPAVGQAGDAGVPVAQALPEAEPGASFVKLAERLADRIAVEHFVATGGDKAPSTQAPTRLKIIR